MRLKVSYITNRGKFREKNEDALLVAGELLAETSLSSPLLRSLELSGPTLFAVADGMGGLPCGEVASRLTLDYIKDSSAEGKGELMEVLRRAKLYLDHYVETHKRCYGMGTALSGAYLKSGRAMVFNVGDCRVYLLREDKLEQLTRDHTEAYQLYLKGLIDGEELRRSPYRNLLTSAIMGGIPEEFEVFVREEKLLEGDTYLICSDGLWDELYDEEIRECMTLGVEEGGRCLFERAYRGGRDNISFILLKVP